MVQWWACLNHDRVVLSSTHGWGNFLSGIFLLLTSGAACEKTSRWLWKESCFSTGVKKPGNMCVTDCHDMTSAHYPLPNFVLFQTERVCRWQFHIWKKWQKVLQMNRKHCGKRRNCSLRAISSFPTVFLKDLYCWHEKTRVCLGKG